jgi:hypothetical protein
MKLWLLFLVKFHFQTLFANNLQGGENSANLVALLTEEMTAAM